MKEYSSPPVQKRSKFGVLKNFILEATAVAGRLSMKEVFSSKRFNEGNKFDSEESIISGRDEWLRKLTNMIVLSVLLATF